MRWSELLQIWCGCHPLARSITTLSRHKKWLLLPRVRCFSKEKIVPKTKFDIPPTVKIFENTTLNPYLFRVTTVISGIQLCLWCYLSYFALTELNPAPRTDQKVENETTSKEDAEKNETKDHIVGSSEDDSDIPEAIVSIEGSKRELFTDDDTKNKPKEQVSEEKKEDPSKMYKWFMSSKWRLSLSLLSLGAGTVFAMVAFIYPQRMVRTLTYIRPTQVLEVETYTPWGLSKKFGVPLNSVFCNTTPEQAASGQNIALKIKDYSLYFMLNTKNTTSHPMLKTLVLSRRNL